MTSQTSKHSLLRDILLAFAGAAGTAFVGLIASSDLLNSLKSYFITANLPKNSIIFVNAEDCGGADWKPYKIAAGHFIVGAGGNFVAGQANTGRKDIEIKKENLPQIVVNVPFSAGVLPTNLNYTSGTVTFVTGIADSVATGIKQPPFVANVGGSGATIATLPPSLPLTACQRS